MAALGLLIASIVFNMTDFLIDALKGQPAIVRRADSPDPESWIAEAACAVLVVGGIIFAALPNKKSDVETRSPRQ